ncbi:MAG: hypothetical protein PHT51_04800 [Patescibacteria group bacterium]|nr:hypothetical protein [Patescibacteria group bacterium]MDD4611196.1 hypothetical protein [Patescibacteria group bacterium]
MEEKPSDNLDASFNQGERGKEEEISEKVREYARNIFNQMFSSLEKPESEEAFFDILGEVEHALSILAESESDWEEEKKCTENFRIAVSIFLDELLNFCREKKDDQNFRNFMEKISRSFFSENLNIDALLDFRQYFYFYSKATRYGISNDMYLDQKLNNTEPIEKSDSEKKEQDFNGNVRKYAENIFNRMFLSHEKSEGREMGFGILEETENVLSVLADYEKEWGEERLYTNNFVLAVDIFLDELIDFCKERKDDDNFPNFMGIIYKSFFSSSPNIASALNFERYFNFCAKTTRFSEIQAYIGGNVNGELEYKIGWDYNPNSKNDELLKSYNESSIAEKLDKLNLLEILGADLISAGSSFNFGDKKLIKLLDKISKENDNAFLGFYINSVRERIVSEYDAPTRGIVQFSGDSGNARLREGISSEDREMHVKLDNIIKPDKHFSSDGKFSRVADDVLCVLNHANIPVYYAKFDFSAVKDFKPSVEISAADLMNLKKLLQREKAGETEIDFDKFMAYSNGRILEPFYKIKNSDPKKLAEIWQKFSENISPEDWNDFFELDELREKFLDQIDNIKKVQEKKAQELNWQATLDVFKYSEKIGREILDGIKDAGELSDMFKKFIDAFTSGDMEYAFNNLEIFVLRVSDLPEEKFQNPKIYQISQGLAEKYSQLNEVHGKNWEECYEIVEESKVQFAQKYRAAIDRFNELYGKISSDQDNIYKNFELELNKIEFELDKERIKVDFNNFSDFINREEMISVDAENMEEMDLLLQHLYRPKMKKQIEESFGVRLNELPFYCQIYFLKFLSEKNRNQAEEVRQFIHQGQDDETRNNRIKSFLALEVDGEIGERILKIGKNLPVESADLIFAKYSELIDLNQNIKERLSAFLQVEEITPEIIKKINQNFIRKANELIINFSNKKIKTNDKQSQCQEILNELEGYKKDLVLTAGIFKELRGRKNITFEELEGITFEQTTAAHLSNSPDVIRAVGTDLPLINEAGFPMIPGSALKGAVKKFSQAEQHSLETIEEMMAIYSKNYVHNPLLQKKLLSGFLEKLKTSGDKTKIYVLRQNGEVVAFSRFDDLGEGEKYFGSFNVAPEGANLDIGAAMLEKILDLEASDAKKITADVEPYKSIASSYVEKFGFVVTQVKPNYVEADFTAFEIVRSEGNKKLYYRDYSLADLIKEYEKIFLIINIERGSKE